MNAKKYVLAWIIIFVLTIAVLSLFACGLRFKETSPAVFYTLIISACVSLISEIVFISCNHKKLVAYEVNNIEKKTEALDFSSLEMSVNENILQEKLKNHGYKKVAENMFHKKITDSDCGDQHYFAAIFKAEKITNMQGFAKAFSKKFSVASNIGYIFLERNVDSSFEAAKRSIKEYLIDKCAHPFRQRDFFVPIVISDGKIFYLQAGARLSEYRHGLSEGLRILRQNKQKRHTK